MFRIGGWHKVMDTGSHTLFKMLYDENNEDENYISLTYTDGALSLKRYTTSWIWEFIVQSGGTPGEWNWAEVQLGLPYYPEGGGETDHTNVSITTLSGNIIRTQVQAEDGGLAYVGRDSTTYTSSFLFPGSNIFLADWYICPVQPGHTGAIQNPLGYKYGRYQTLIEDGTEAEQQITAYSFNKGVIDLPASDPGNTFYSVGCHTFYDASSRMNFGIQLFDDQSFRNTPSYYLLYDTSKLASLIGNNASPIRIGNTLPREAINLARVSTPEFTADSTVSTIDLSYLNTSNLTMYKNGEFSVKRNGGTSESFAGTGSFKGINSGFFDGLLNIEFSGQLFSDNTNITTIGISNSELETPREAYYAYLIGRGQRAVKIPEYYPHTTGEIGTYTTGDALNNYMFNVQSVRDSITLRDSDGVTIPYNSFPYDIIVSPENPRSLIDKITNIESININGIGPYTGKHTLPDGTFSVILLTSEKTLNDNTSVWAHYTSYNISNTGINTNHKEIVNSMPIMREAPDTSIAMPGQYSFDINPDTLLYSLKVYGIQSGYVNKF